MNIEKQMNKLNVEVEINQMYPFSPYLPEIW
jgi:hypothetical protein